jgi:hypothetical protein
LGNPTAASQRNAKEQTSELRQSGSHFCN